MIFSDSVPILLKTSDNNLDLFSLQRHGDVITSVEGQQTDNLVRLCSTTEVLWIDGRFTRSPLLAYKHGRSFDRTLETRTVLLPSTLVDSMLYFRSQVSGSSADLFNFTQERTGNHL